MTINRLFIVYIQIHTDTHTHTHTHAHTHTELVNVVQFVKRWILVSQIYSFIYFSIIFSGQQPHQVLNRRFENHLLPRNQETD